MSRRKLKKLKRWIVGRILILVIKLLQCNSFYTAGERGARLGRTAFWILPRFRRQALDNLDRVFGNTLTPLQKKRIAYEAFKNFGRFALEALNIGDLSAEEICDIVRADEGEKLLAESFQKGRSVLIITGHFSNWELFAARVSHMSPLSVIAKTNTDPHLQKIVNQIRGVSSISVLDRDDPGIVRKFRKISKRGGEVLGILMDQDTRVKGVFSPFLGINANTPSGPAALALKDWFDVFSGFVFHEGDGRYVLKLKGPLQIKRTGHLQQDIQLNTNLFNMLISEQIMEDPSQWAWIHRRWRRGPSDFQ